MELEVEQRYSVECSIGIFAEQDSALLWFKKNKDIEPILALCCWFAAVLVMKF